MEPASAQIGRNPATHAFPTHPVRLDARRPRGRRQRLLQPGRPTHLVRILLPLPRSRLRDAQVGTALGPPRVRLRARGSLHRRVHRPWGWYDSIDMGPRFQVKRIMVKPKASLSLQMHHHRAEHWIVVSGTAEVTVGEQVVLLSENQSTYIPLGQVHRLSNPGKVPLEIIEVQSGSYLGEDDIVRFEDTYGRA
mgnify:CR=1 FL=1